jgi:cell shape-determining protein MreD
MRSAARSDRSAATALLLVAFAVALYFLFRPLFVRHPWAPDLLVGGLLLGALQLRAGAAGAVGFVLGLLEASMALQSPGPTALVLTLAGYAAARSRDLLFADARYFVFVYLLVGTWATRSALLLATTDGVPGVSRFLGAGLASALLTALLGSAAEGWFSRVRS